MEYLGIVVDDLEAGVQRFSDLFDLEFEILNIDDLEVRTTDGAIPDAQAPQSRMRVAVDSSGFFELVEVAGADEGFRNIHFRVDSVEDAIAELSGRGLHLVRHFVVGQMREAIFASDDLFGLRVCLLEYAGPSLSAAMRAKGPEVAKGGGGVDAIR
ncbi:hypothetical protein ACJ5H2_22885 (plasmid) [Nocardioides sp. R1-1]|uniref:hypothetical protein n=1 Tax=Nocardioides sp. R1-1 TaxID=3383502 RepID=UPI0038CFF041